MILGSITLAGAIDRQSNHRSGPFAHVREDAQVSAEGREAGAYAEQSKPTDAQVRENCLMTIKAPAVVAYLGHD